MIFNGVDLEQYFEDDFIVKDVRGRTITQNELETLSIPLANGEILIDSKIPPKVLEVDIALNANTKRDLNRKIDELNSIIHTKETVPIILKDEPDMTYYGILGTSNEEPEEANVHEATLNIMVLDGLKYGPKKEIKINPMEENKIYYAGTEPVIPEVEIIPKEKTTFAGYTDGQKSVLFGIPITTEDFAYDPKPVIFNNVMSDRSDWFNATAMHGITVGGEYTTSRHGITPIDYGDGSGWHGPSLIRTLTEPLVDFELQVYMTLKNETVNQMSRMEWHLLSADNEIQARLRFEDRWPLTNLAMAEILIGNPAREEKVQILDRRWSNNIMSVIKIKKVGNQIDIYGSRIVDNLYHIQTNKKTFIDNSNLFSKPISKVQIATCQYDNYPTNEPYFLQIALFKINPPQNEMIPYIANEGDSIIIDNSLNAYINGELGVGLNVYSRPIELQKGENNLTVLPPNADVTVRFREVFK